MLQRGGEWNLGEFQRVALDDNVEILMHESGKHALVVWPWWVDEDKVQASSWKAQTMGFVDIVEVGNMVGYSIPEVEADDFDFMLLEADS